MSYPKFPEFNVNPDNESDFEKIYEESMDDCQVI